MAPVDDLAAAIAQAQVPRLDDCAHSPHRDQPETVMHAAIDFISRHRR